MINHSTMFKTLFLKLLFAVESKSGIKMLVNLLLLDIICPKNATLFIRDQLQGVITSQPTVPPPWKLISLSIFLNDFQLNSKLCTAFWNIAFIWCSHSPLAEYWVHCVEYYYSMHAIANNVRLQQYGPGRTKLHFQGQLSPKVSDLQAFWCQIWILQQKVTLKTMVWTLLEFYH